MGEAMESKEKLIASNPIARFNYFIEKVFEAGVVLTGTEVKSLRVQSPNLRDSYIEILHFKEAWLLNTHIAPYVCGNRWNHEPLRKRKLLLQKKQINELFEEVTRNGRTIVPLRFYFKRGLVKLEIAVAKGKKKYDKRASLKKKEALIEMRDFRLS